MIYVFVGVYLGMENDVQILEERFWPKVDKSPGHGPNGDCWLWTAARNNPNGYGVLGNKKNDAWRIIYAHRLSYQIATGVDPKDLFVCHHCDNKQCVNPVHLFLGTHQDNTDDMVQKGKHPNQGKLKAACKNGHLFTSANTRQRSDCKGRVCIQCARNRGNEARAKETLAERTARLARNKPLSPERQKIKNQKEREKRKR